MSANNEDAGEAEWDCALPFLTDSVEFACGVEVGMLWEQLKATDRIAGPYLLANQDQILLMLSRLKWRVEKLEAVDGFWFHIEAIAPERQA